LLTPFIIRPPPSNESGGRWGAQSTPYSSCRYYRCIDVCMLCLRNSAIIFIITFTIHYYGSARKVHATPKEESYNRYFFRLKVFILSSLKPLI
jgi:hypothetical protein